MGSGIPTVLDGCGSEKSVSRRTYQVVVAATREGGLGKDGKIAWHIPTDSQFFEDVTTKTSNPEKMNAVVMGRKSWESWGSALHDGNPYHGRVSVILTHSLNFDVGGSENVLVCGSLDSALELLASPPYNDLIETVFNIGGGILLRESLNAPACDAIHITEMETSIECDTFIPSINTNAFHPWYSSFPLTENNIRYSFVTYVRVRGNADENTQDNTCRSNCGMFERHNFSVLPQMLVDRHGEYMYLRLVQDILTSGNLKNDSAGTGTLSKFGCQMRFNLRKTFPLLTTKSVSWGGVVEELLCFISDSTNSKLSDVIHKIKNNPDDGSSILSCWNPSGIKTMVLPQCHMFAQFYVANGELSCLMYQQSVDIDLEAPFSIASYGLLTCLIAHVCANGELSCLMYQQSVDIDLEAPFSIASYGLLTCLIAHVCDLIPGDLIHDIGVAQVYLNHIESLQEKIKNPPKPFPVLKINPKKKSIDSFEPADFSLTCYDSHLTELNLVV